LNEVWNEHLKPHIASIAQPLLSGVAKRLEDMHNDLLAWDRASREWDPVSYGRSAIEPNEQDQYPESIDVLIDAARDGLEWLAANVPALLDAWMERLVCSGIPLLHRLAVHAITVHQSKSADERLGWLLKSVDLNGTMAHHEVHRAVALSYAEASEDTRQKIVEAVLAHTQPAAGDWTAEMRTSRSHFDWLSWLLQAKPDCNAAVAALAPIRAHYPEWLPSEHPDLTHWMGAADWVGSRSPWPVEELLARDAIERLDEMLVFEGNRFGGPDRGGLIETVREACKQRSTWGFALADALAARQLWSSDLWPAVIRGWQDATLTPDEWRAALTMAATPELQTAQAYDIANLLYAIVRNGGGPFALDLLERANPIALSLWRALEPNERGEDIHDWLSQAINRPAGFIVEFWINGLSLLMHGKSATERMLPENYRQWFTIVVQDASSKGGLGRSVLASQTAFLFGLDEAWTRQHIVPLFSDADRQKFAQAWDGFLVWGRLYPALVDALMPAFISAFSRIGTDFPDQRRRRLVEFYAALAVFHVADPTAQLLPALFQHGSVEDRINLAAQIGHFLGQMQPAARQQLWDAWVHRYWQDRLQSVPAALDDGEVRKMVGWLPHLGDLFPAAVDMVVRSPRIRMEHSLVTHRLRDSALVASYPTKTAELLIYLCDCVVGYHAVDLGIIAGRLPVLEPDLRRHLDEGLARAGVQVNT
jgi:hypothetical protein